MPSPPKSALELLGLPAAPRTGRERLIAAAVELFYRHGFAAVGIDRIIAEAGVTRTTFYKHFEGKDDLMVAAVQRRDEWESQAWARAVHRIAGDDPVRQLLAMLEVMDVWFNDPDFRGCIFINIAAEFTDRRDPIHRAASAYKRRARDRFRDLAAEAGASDPEAFADEYTLLLEGTLILRHAHDRDDAARVAKPLVERLLARQLPPIAG